MKMEFCSQRIEMCLFLATTMAAMTSRANQQYPAGVTQLCYQLLCDNVQPFYVKHSVCHRLLLLFPCHC